jgi:GTP pyrophosphokinase
VVHTDLGHRTRGAKIDGNIVPLITRLQNGQRIEILTTKQGGPSRDWLSPKLGFLQSARARAKVRRWFSEQNLDDSIAQGRILLDRELHRLGVTDINQEKLAQRLHFNKLDELLADLGRSEITTRRIALAIQQELPTRTIVSQVAAARPAAQRASSTGVLVAGVDNLMIRMAKCCKPEAPHAIVGYVTRDRGITIHTRDCSFMLRVPEDKQDRLLDAEWAKKVI